jgi:VCBS repeat-containing protein
MIRTINRDVVILFTRLRLMSLLSFLSLALIGNFGTLSAQEKYKEKYKEKNKGKEKVKESNFAESFPVGTGSQFLMTMMDGTTTEVSISITAANSQSLNVEYYFSVLNTFLPIKIWQQFQLKRSDDQAPLKLTHGYIKIPEWDKSEELTQEYLAGYDGVQLSDFLFQHEQELAANKVGEENLTVLGGTTPSIHYRKKSGGQTVDFWLAEEARPLALVKLKSSHKKKAEQNYQLELLTLLKNVKPNIDPTLAIPMTQKGKDLLGRSKVIH